MTASSFSISAVYYEQAIKSLLLGSQTRGMRGIVCDAVEYAAVARRWRAHQREVDIILSVIQAREILVNRGKRHSPT